MLCACGGTSLHAQGLYDVSEAYLNNYDFDSGYDYAVGETGNVAQEIRDVAGWTKDFSVDYTITGTYQIGTAKTFNGAAVPATAHDGTTAGGVLALSTGWGQMLKFYQEVTLPAGSYKLASAFYNGGDKTPGGSLVAWIPASGPAVQSALTEFAVRVWTPDTLSFTLTAPTKGRIQVGFLATVNKGSANLAKVSLDYVRLLRTTPMGSADVDLKKQALAADIAAATARLGEATGEVAATFRAAIAAAQAVHDNASATLADVNEALMQLAEAVEIFSWASPTGEKPTVTTNKRFARGATMAFGRLTVSGKDVVEQGFCWSTSPEPTINDSRTTNFLNHKGSIYWIQGLTPATRYYMRAYAITRGKQVGYGDVIKFYTIPKGRLGYTMRDGGDAEARTRIDAAMKAAVNWWNNLTSIQGVTFNVGHNPGTPTADCSYGGYIRVGSNTSYQRTGTMLHEMAHGVGVGTHNPWWDGEMRSNGNRGLWLGDRATEVLRFWDNSETATVNGDNMHFWPYGINGAFEDDGSDALYIIQSLLVQAFGEDGLPPSGGFATPAYSLDQEDDTRYYLKNESPDNGLYSAYMVERADGSVALRELAGEEAAANDSAAWNVTFDPARSFYAFRNVGTGRYLTYVPATAAITTTTAATPTANMLFHLMRSRKDVLQGSKLRGYWIIRNTGAESPNAMSARNGSDVGTSTYSLANSATAQRWLVLDQSQMGELETLAMTGYARQLTDYVALVKKLRATPHTEDAPGTDQALDDRLAAVEAQQATATTSAQLAALLGEARSAGFDFLANATPKSMAQPFDLTFMIQNAGMDKLDGWSGTPALGHSAAEFYQSTFNFSQTLAHLPAGCYQLKAQAFQRPGSAADAYTAYAAGTDKVTTYLYLGPKSVKVKQAVADAQTAKLGVGSESTLASTPATYIPNDMQSASAYFGRGLYDNEVFADLEADDASLRLGIRCGSSDNMYWTIFDNFRLYYYGSLTADVVAGIRDVQPRAATPADNVYTLDGRLVRRHAKSLEGLPRGIYIVGGKKVVR